jgi:hypothetical protein
MRGFPHANALRRSLPRLRRAVFFQARERRTLRVGTVTVGPSVSAGRIPPFYLARMIGFWIIDGLQVGPACATASPDAVLRVRRWYCLP